MTERKPLHTGGCQCGKVRYAIYGETTNPHICHCRMCQKAFGSFFAPLVGVKLVDFAWTRGEPGIFRSSEIVERGFCRDCGTPLSFRYTTKEHIAVAIGSLDEPARIEPAHQYGVESRVPYFAELAGLPGTATEDDIPPEEMKRLASRQHPDRE
jgi:hypothetical protein